MLGMAYGFLEMNINGQRVLWHLGESARFITVLALIPEQNLGLVESYNTSPADGRAILFRFMDAFFPVQRALLPATPLPGWEAHAAAANGFYLPARSAHTTLQRVLAYLQAAPVIIANGALTYNGWRFVETEPWLFRQAAGDRVLALRQDASGQRWLLWGRWPTIESRASTRRVFCCPLPVLACWSFSLPGLPGRWRPGAAASGPGRRQWRRRWLAAGLGLFNVGLLIWFALLMAGFGATFVFPQAAAGLIARLSWLAVPWTLCVLALAGRGWVRRTGDWPAGSLFPGCAGCCGLPLVVLERQPVGRPGLNHNESSVCKEFDVSRTFLSSPAWSLVAALALGLAALSGLLTARAMPHGPAPQPRP